MSNTVTIEIDNEVEKYINKFTIKYNKSIDEVVTQLITIGFEQKFSNLYRKYQACEINLGWLGQELGLSLRNVYSLLEKETCHCRQELIESPHSAASSGKFLSFNGCIKFIFANFLTVFLF